jgi:carboxypeptidase C (cathepsin A)
VDIGGGKEIFYWFVESQRDPAKDPLVLWTNGGPGCSGLTGFLSEQGPFRAAADGSLSVNKYAWNKIANMVFIEQPAGNKNTRPLHLLSRERAFCMLALLLA